MKWLKFKKRSQRDNSQTPPLANDFLLQALFQDGYIDAQKAMNIPSVANCVNLISETVSMIPIKLYEERVVDGKQKTVEITSDNRPELLNSDTKDTLDGIQFKRALVRDYLLYGSAYAYINKTRNKIQSINYVSCKNVSIQTNNNPIFKDYNISVLGKTFKPFEFLKILRSTKDGARGMGIIQENSELLSTAYKTMKFEQNLVGTGGNKKGFLKAKSRLTKEAIDALKRAWQQLYSNNSENVIVLNDGLEFQEASNTSVEMQLNEGKKSTSDDISGIFGVPTKFDYDIYIKTAIIPVLTAIECALNRDFLLEKEKKSFYFAFDTKEITKLLL